MAEMGTLVGDLSRALREVLGCEKTYVMQLSEAPGFSHLHVHVVPRMPDQPEDRRGPAVFGYLGEDETAWVPTDEMDRVALDRPIAGPPLTLVRPRGHSPVGLPVGPA